MSLFICSTHESIFAKNSIRIKSQNIFFEKFFKAQQSYNIFSLVVSKFTLKIPVEIFSSLIRKLYWLCNESCFFWTPFLSINCLTKNHFRVAEQQKYLLHVSKAYFKNLLHSFFRERVATLRYGRDETFPNKISAVRLSLQSVINKYLSISSDYR